MTVTVYLEGPTKASKWLSPLTTRALGLGQASWHTTLAAGIWGQAVSWVGVGVGHQNRHWSETYCCGKHQPGLGRSHSSEPMGPGCEGTKTPVGTTDCQEIWGLSQSDHQVTIWLARVTVAMGGGRLPCWPGAQASGTHFLLGKGGHRLSLTFNLGGLVSPKTTLGSGGLSSVTVEHSTTIGGDTYPHPRRDLTRGWLGGQSGAGAGPGGLTCHTKDAALGRAAVVLGQGAPRAGAEQEAAVGAGGQAGDGSAVTPAHTRRRCLASELHRPRPPAESRRGSRGRGFQ